MATSISGTELVPGQGFPAVYHQEINSAAMSGDTWSTLPPVCRFYSPCGEYTDKSVSLAPISPLSDTDTLPFGLLTPHQEFSTPKTLSLQDKAGSIVNETTPLITSKSSCQTDSELSTKCCTIRCSKFGKFWTCMIMLIICSVLIFLSVIGQIYVLACHPLSSKGQELAVNNDTVLLTCKPKWLFNGNIKFAFSGGHITSQTTALIFMVHPDALYKIIKTRQQPLRHPLSNKYAQLIPLQTTKQFFYNCSSYISKCILEQYLYLVNSGSAFINFQITLSSFVPRETQVRVSAYDSPESCQAYLEGKGDNALKQIYMKHKSDRFVLTSLEMSKPSYIFIVIEDIKGSVSSFTYDRVAQENFYNATSLRSVCQLDHSNSFECSLKSSRSYGLKNCFLAQVQREQSIKQFTVKNLTYIQFNTNDFVKTFVGIALLVLLIFSVISLCILTIIIVLYCFKRYKANLN